MKHQVEKGSQRSTTRSASGSSRTVASRRRHTRLIGIVVMLLALVAGMIPLSHVNEVMSARALPAGQTAKEAVIVEVERGANPEAVARGLGVRPDHVYTNVIRGFAAELPAAAVRAAERQQGVRRIWPDRQVQTEAQKLPTGVNRVDADKNPWANINRKGGSIDVDVAVIDTGIAKHRELTIAGGQACAGNTYSDDDGHGSHVAGTIAAKDNNRGVVGVAPGARLWAVRVFDESGSAAISSVICGLEWVYNHLDTIDVVNMSLSAEADEADEIPCGGTGTAPLRTAICNVIDEGVTVVVAAGNQGKDAATRVPAAYDEVITVSAFTDFDGKPGGQGRSSCASGNDDTFTRFSNFGSDIDIAAPGMCIRSTWLNGKYRSLDGTSMSTPHVTGAVALYIANSSAGKQPAEVRDWLLNQASRPQDSQYGFSGDSDGDPEPVLYLGPE